VRITRIYLRESSELVVIGLLAAVLVAAAASRRDFIGDGVRHLPAALAGPLRFGEARWVMFPPLLFALLRPLAAAGLIDRVESAIQPVLWFTVACGLVFLASVDKWLRADCDDPARRAAALLLAGSCAPFLALFSDIAEVQAAATIAVAGLAYARAHPDGGRGAVVAITAIAAATLIYEGTILALGMLPLVATRQTLLRRRVLGALSIAVAIVPVVIIAAQAAGGMPLDLAVAAPLAGERNPLARSLMTQPSAAKFAVALLAGPPQGIVALKDFSGVPALWAGLRASDAVTTSLATANVLRLMLGLSVGALLFAGTVRRRDWRVILAGVVILVLPLFRNQQYAYVKFFALWPVPVALAALRCRARAIAVAASLVLLSNGWLLAEEIQRGRRLHAALGQAYAAATPTTCWMTSGWAPPMWYLWPGTTTPVLGILSTGSDPRAQAVVLTESLRSCFCDSTSVWTDTTAHDSSVVASLAGHFDYRDVDLATLLLAESTSRSEPPTGIYVYPEPARRQICGVVTAAGGRPR
jgi:hypothetical protein